MPGIRIQHPTERSTTFTLVDGSRPLVVLVECGVCHRTHTMKTYHLTLDDTGSAIVSFEIVERLKRIPGQPFSIANVVDKPPDQVIRVPRLIIKSKVLEWAGPTPDVGETHVYGPGGLADGRSF